MRFTEGEETRTVLLCQEYSLTGHKRQATKGGGHVVLEVLEVDILWPRWVARIGVTRATEACFLAADRQCTELPLLRLPRLVPEFRGSDPMRQTRDLARVGSGGARCKEGLRKKPIPVVRPAPPHRAA